MPLLLQYLHVIGIFQGTLLAGLLIFSNNNCSANRILGVWCLSLALYFAGPFITMDNEINAFSHLIGWSYFLPASFGTFLYLYCRNAVVEQRFTLSDLWLFLPFVSCILLNIDILTSSPSIKLGIIKEGPSNSIRFIVSEIIQGLQAFVFLGFSYLSIHKYQSKAENTLSNFNPAIFNWLLKLIMLFLSIWLLKLSAGLFSNLSYLAILADILIVFMIYSIAMAQWRNPKLFTIEQLAQDTIDTYSELDLSNASERSKSTLINNISLKKSSALDESIRVSLLASITKHMEEQQTFLDNQLTLTRLSEAVGITNHHLSEVLNQQQGKNFYQFVNEYRVEYFCQQLQQDQTLTLLDLAMNAGFSSKSTFNSTFKQIKGLTPSQYRQSLSA